MNRLLSVFKSDCRIADVAGVDARNDSLANQWAMVSKAGKVQLLSKPSRVRTDRRAEYDPTKNRFT